jgi:prepilin-type N-terminal cleavage/methylation domain-containing protein
MKRLAGFSILELIIVIVVMAIGAVAIGSAFLYMTRSQRLAGEITTANQIAQECAAHVVGLARHPGTYAAVPAAAPSGLCNTLPAIEPGFARTLNITTMAAGGALCGGGWACKRVEVLVARGGRDLVALDFMLVNY